MEGETYEIDAQILRSASSAGKIGFIGAASGDTVGYFEGFKKYYTELIKELKLPPREFVFITRDFSPIQFKETVASCSIIYLGGGETKLLLSALENWHAALVFRAALENGTILAGISAGAYALSRKSLHVENGKVEENVGLDLVPYLAQAHATPETEKIAREYIKNSPELSKILFISLKNSEARFY